jgi:uncharacterized protein (TIGR03382 family)
MGQRSAAPRELQRKPDVPRLFVGQRFRDAPAAVVRHAVRGWCGRNRDIPPNDPDYPIISSGVLGLHGPGQADPRVPGDDPNDGFLHEFPFPAPVTLGPGLYYFSIYGDGLGMGNTTGFSNAAWLTGADLVPPSLERNYQWRSQSYPVPGFVNYTSPAIAPLPGQDPADIWNCSFTFYGPQIPGPGAASLLGLGLVAALRRRR